MRLAQSQSQFGVSAKCEGAWLESCEAELTDIQNVDERQRHGSVKSWYSSVCLKTVLYNTSIAAAQQSSCCPSARRLPPIRRRFDCVSMRNRGAPAVRALSLESCHAHNQSHADTTEKHLHGRHAYPCTAASPRLTMGCTSPVHAA